MCFVLVQIFVGLDGEDEGDCVEGEVGFGEDKVGLVEEEEELDMTTIQLTAESANSYNSNFILTENQRTKSIIVVHQLKLQMHMKCVWNAMGISLIIFFCPFRLCCSHVGFGKCWVFLLVTTKFLIRHKSSAALVSLWLLFPKPLLMLDK